jgi:hypothetical protein
VDQYELRYAILECILERFVPRDEHPGATEAAAGTYVGQRLTSDLETELDRIHAALDDFQLEAETRFGKGFLELHEHEQDEILLAAERGRTSARWSESPKWAFELFLNLAMEAFTPTPRTAGTTAPYLGR